MAVYYRWLNYCHVSFAVKSTCSFLVQLRMHSHRMTVYRRGYTVVGLESRGGN